MTGEVKITQGVLQGEVLNPYEFLLFISDFEAHFIDYGCKGLSIDSKTEILMLGYVDDFVLLADTPSELVRKLEALFSYCQLNNLVVNINKTKIVIFSKSGNSLAKKFKSFKFGNDRIEVVNEHVYLGIPFSGSSTFTSAARRPVSAANTAIRSTLSAIRIAGTDSWSFYNRLLEGLCLSILFYGCFVRNLNHLDYIEAVQLSFYKKLLQLLICSPGYAVRLETGSLHTSFAILKNLLSWLNKISRMENTRYPRRCFEKLKLLAVNNKRNKFNWYNQLRFV